MTTTTEVNDTMTFAERAERLHEALTTAGKLVTDLNDEHKGEFLGFVQAETGRVDLADGYVLPGRSPRIPAHGAAASTAPAPGLSGTRGRTGMSSRNDKQAEIRTGKMTSHDHKEHR